MLLMNMKIKKDKYRQSRGGGSQFLEVTCSACSHRVLIYQKDGKGALVRLYLDRIHHPEELVARVSGWQTLRDMSDLMCDLCGAHLARKMVYERENRLALRIIRGAIMTSRFKS